MFKSGEMIVQRDDMVNDFTFIYVGVAHLYDYKTLQDGEVLRSKLVTLKKGSWYGDYQIMLDQNSTWDLEAGNDGEWNPKSRPVGMPHNHILAYTI